MLNKQKGRIYKSKQSYEAQKRKANHIEACFYLKEMLNGLLLGDGSFEISERGKSASYSHGDKHESYIYWLSRKLDLYGLRQSGKIIKMKNNAYKYRTLFYYELYDIAKYWYPKGKKTIPDYMKIRPNILKHWYIGDGNFSDTPIIDSSIFKFNKLEFLCKELSRMNIKFTLRKFKDRSRIRISAKSQELFFKYILSDDPFIHDCYAYKFPKEFLYGIK